MMKVRQPRQSPQIFSKLIEERSSFFLISITSILVVTSLLFGSISIAGKKRKFKKRWKRKRRKKGQIRKKKVDKVSIGVGVIAFNQDNGKIVVGLRKKTHGENTWALPGGWLEKGESFEECGLRELFEETGIKNEEIESFKLLNTAPYLNEIKIYVNPPIETEGKVESKEEAKFNLFYSATAFVLVKLKKGEEHKAEVKEVDKCSEWKWIKSSKVVEEFDSFGLFPSLRHFLSLGIDLKSA